MVSPRLISHLRIVWRFGGPLQRLSLLSILVVFAIVVTVAIWLVRELFLMTTSVEVVTSVGFAAVGASLFRPALQVPMYSARVVRALLDVGWQSDDGAYFQELARYLDSHGRNGTLPGGGALSLAYLAIYASTVALAMPLAETLRPSFGIWTPAVFLTVFEVPVTVSAFLFYVGWIIRRYREAEEAGFYLLPARIMW